MSDAPKKPTVKEVLFAPPKSNASPSTEQGRIKSNTAPELKRDDVRREIEPRGVVARVPAPGGASTQRHSAAQLNQDQKPAMEQPGKNKPFRRFNEGEMKQDFNQAANRKPKHKI